MRIKTGLAIAFLLLPIVGCAHEASLRTTELGPNKCLATDGNDQSSGRFPDACWRTFQAAADRVLPGDRVCFQPGTYGGAKITRSGTVPGRITWARCPNVQQGAVLIRQNDEKTRRVIEITGNVTDHTIDGLDWSPELYGAGVDGLYMAGGNHRWHVRNMRFLGEKRSGKQLWDKTTEIGPNGQNNRRRLWRIKGNDIVLEKNFARYWPFQFLSESDGTYRALVAYNNFAYSGSHTVAIASKCLGQIVRTGNNYYRNIFGGSYTSDSTQINLDTSSGNPHSPDGMQGPQLLPCKGGYRLTQNIMVANAENGPDMKGWDNSIIEFNAFVTTASDSSGPIDGINFSCGGGYVGRPQTSILARGNLSADNSNAHANTRAEAAVYGISAVHNWRSAIGVDRDKCGGNAVATAWASNTTMVNNLIDSHGSGPNISVGSNLYADGNVYAEDTRWQLDKVGSYQTLELWQEALRKHANKFVGFDENAQVIPRQQLFEVDTEHWTMGQAYPDTFAIEDIVERLPELYPSADLETGGAPVGFVERDGFGHEVYVGRWWTSFCCAWEQAAGWHSDVVLIDGKKRQLGGSDGQPGVDAKRQMLILSEPLQVEKGQAIDVVYPSGRTSRQRGAHEFWAGTEVIVDPPEPPEPPPVIEPPSETVTFSIPTSFSENDAEEECPVFDELGTVACPVNLTSGFLDLVGIKKDGLWNETGLRFDTLGIDDKTVDIRLQFTPTATRTGVTSVAITLESSSNCRPFAVDDGNLSARARVDAVVPWVIHGDWTADFAVETPSLKPLFLALIENRVWKSGSAVCLFVKPTTDQDQDYKAVFSFDRDAPQAPALIVERTID